MGYNQSVLRKRWFILVSATAMLLLAAVLLYRVPAVQTQVLLRKEFALAYLRGILYPARAVPTPVLRTITATPTPLQTATPTTAEQPTDAPTPTAEPTATPEPPPATIQLPAPAYEKQDWNNCGPATLAMALRYWGWEGNQAQISDLIKPLREDRNVNVEELVYYVSNYAGWLRAEYRVGGSLELLRRLLAHGYPVIIEEAMKMDAAYWNNDDLWAGHYLLLTGYDDRTGAFTAQDSYYGPSKQYPYTDLDANWKTFNRVLILIFPPDETTEVQQVLGADWDISSNRERALAQARAETEVNPADAFAWFNVGSNLVYFEKYGEAAAAYDTARTLGLPQRMLRYQFGPFWAYFHSGRTEDLLTLTKYALQRTPNSEEALLWEGWGLFRQGEVESAAGRFRKALQANPNFADAKYALQYIGYTP